MARHRGPGISAKTKHLVLFVCSFREFKDPYRGAVTRIQTGVAAATTQSTHHYTITAGSDVLQL